MANKLERETIGEPLARRANTTLALKIVAAATTYGFLVVLARVMPLDGFGTVAFFLNMSLLLSIAGARGQQMAILRFLPQLVEAHDLAKMKAFVFRAARRSAATTLVFAAALAALAALLHATFGRPDFDYPVMLLGFALVPLVAWLDFQSHLARALHLVKTALVPKEVLWRLLAAVAVLAAFSVNGRLPLTPVFVLVVLLSVLTVLGAAQGLVLFRIDGLDNLARTRPAASDKSWRDSETAFWISSVSNVFLANAGVIVVGAMAGPADAALFFAASRLAMLQELVLTSNNMVLGPMLSQAWHAEGHGPARQLVLRSTWRTFVPAAVLTAGLVFAAPAILRVFGAEFAQAATILKMLAIAGLVNAGLGPGDIALNMCGQHRAAMRVSLLTLVASALFLLIGTTLAGAPGAAAGVLAATVLRKVLFWTACRERLGLRTDFLAAVRYRYGQMAARPT